MANERVNILEDGVKLTMQDRNKTYGSFVENMKEFAEFFEAYSKGESVDSYTAEHNMAIIMALGKIARIASGSLHRDNYVDAAVYLAAAYECEVANIPQDTCAVKPETDTCAVKPETDTCAVKPETDTGVDFGTKDSTAFAWQCNNCGVLGVVRTKEGAVKATEKHHCLKGAYFCENTDPDKKYESRPVNTAQRRSFREHTNYFDGKRYYTVNFKTIHPDRRIVTSA
jgi:hypothetical protein